MGFAAFSVSIQFRNRFEKSLAENFFDVALWYKQKKIAAAVLKIYKTAHKSCVLGKRVQFRKGYLVLQKSGRKVLRTLTRTDLNWPDIERNFRRLLAD